MIERSAAGLATLLLALGTLAPTTARADVDPLSGIDFVTIGATGNAAWAGDGTPGDNAIGKGRVDYEYKIGRFEVTSLQLLDFINVAWDRPASERLPFLSLPSAWGGRLTTPQHGGLRWRIVPGEEMLPVGGIDWRTAATYCNWLHNGKGLERATLLTGAYDVSTFGYTLLPNGVRRFTDQLERSPGARYFLPTLDEWIKAAHYDPVKVNGDGSLGGYWTYSNRSDLPYVGALPPSMGGNGTANFGIDLNPERIPLGAYAGVTSPWGLFDVGGGTTEWMETARIAPSGEASRWLDGTGLLTSPDGFALDRVSFIAGSAPDDGGIGINFRLAAAVPSPASAVPLACVFVGQRRRRKDGVS